MRRPGHVEASMVTRDTAWPSGTPCWVDLGVDDIAKACTFYAGLFGWEIQAGPPETYGYAMCLTNGLAVAGIGPKQGPPGTPAAWTTYLASDDADQTSRRVKAAGGHVLMEPMDIMDVGRMAVAADPGHAVFGIWQARAHIGVGLANEPGTLCWNENFSRDFDRNKAFYQAVFGYEFGDIGDISFNYATLKVGVPTWAASVSLTPPSRLRFPRTGRRTSLLRTPTELSRRSAPSAGAWPGRPGTRPMGGWPWSATTRVRSSH